MEKEDKVQVSTDNDFNKVGLIKLLVIALITATVWNLPADVFGIDGLTVVQQRVISIFVFATLSWLTEAIPAWATSICIIGIMCLTISEKGLLPFQGEDAGNLLKAKDIMATFADPVIFLFLGGFVLAIAARKSGLDMVLAGILIRPFGKKTRNIMLGFLLTTGLFSMFVSNTATAAMMLAFLTPLFASLPAESKARVALTLSIPVAANIGGMGTPIGTPPNAIVLKALNDPEGLNMGIGFGEWMLVMFPLAMFLLFLSWRLLLILFPVDDTPIDIRMERQAKMDWKLWIVVLTFALTVVFWMVPTEYTGVDANVTAVIPICIFAVMGVIKGTDLGNIEWSVIWMVAGGFVLGTAMEDSGLADAAIKSIPFSSWSPMALLIVSGLICFTLSNFISNTATVALLTPFLAIVCTGMGDKLNAVGGTSTVLIGLALTASTAMSLPISTPPNAIAYSTGLVDQKSMMKVGLTVGLIGMVVSYVVLYLVAKLGLL